MTHHVTRARSALKALTWRVLGSLDTFVLGYLITGHVGAAGAIASTEVFTKSVLYYLHERGWDLVQWGHTPATEEAVALHTDTLPPELCSVRLPSAPPRSIPFIQPQGLLYA